MPRRQHGETLPPIRHATLTGFEAPFERHVHEHPTNDQSTAQHDEPGFLLAYSAGRQLEMVRPEIPVTDIAPTILSWFGIAPQPWMHEPAGPRSTSIEHADRDAAAPRTPDKAVGYAWRDRLPAIAFGLKLAITLGLFAYLLRKVESRSVVMQLAPCRRRPQPAPKLLLLVQLVLLALRWQIVNRIVDAPMQAGQVLRLTAIGHFFNQVLPSGFAGDAARAWLAAREGVRLGPAVRAIVCDRVIGLLVLIVMVSVTLFALPDLTADKVPGRRSFATHRAARASGRSRRCSCSARPSPACSRDTGSPVRSARSPTISTARSFARAAGARSSSSLAVAVQLLNVAVMYWCAKGMRIDLDFGARLGHRPGGHAGLDGADLVRRLGRPGGGDDRRARPRGDRGRRRPGGVGRLRVASARARAAGGALWLARRAAPPAGAGPGRPD